MSEMDIRGKILALAEAITQDKPEQALSVAIDLGFDMIVDLHRIANALDSIATTQANLLLQHSGRDERQDADGHSRHPG